MSFQDVIAMPLKSFWALYKQMDRVKASEDLHQISIPGFGSTKEHFTKFVTDAQKAVGHPVIYDTRNEQLDRKGLEKLRNMRYG